MIKITMEVDDAPDNFTGMIEYSDGDKHWYKNDELHREDGPAVEYSNGDKSWFKNGQLHREDGPAIEDANGDKSWYKNGLKHRLDGPACEWTNGYKYWYIDGQQYSEAEFNKKMNKNITTCEGKVIEIDGKKYKLVLSD